MRLQGSGQESKRDCEDETDLHWVYLQQTANI